MNDKDKQIVDQIADVVGDTTKHYEYKKEFQDPYALAKWIESKREQWVGEALASGYIHGRSDAYSGDGISSSDELIDIYNSRTKDNER